MSRRNGTKALFAGRHFDREVILLCVRWYLRYKLCLRDLVEMMAERGLEGSGANSFFLARFSEPALWSQLHYRNHNVRPVDYG
jgi:hypothetical protein